MSLDSGEPLRSMPISRAFRRALIIAAVALPTSAAVQGDPRTEKNAHLEALQGRPKPAAAAAASNPPAHARYRLPRASCDSNRAAFAAMNRRVWGEIESQLEAASDRRPAGYVPAAPNAASEAEPTYAELRGWPDLPDATKAPKSARGQAERDLRPFPRFQNGPALTYALLDFDRAGSFVQRSWKNALAGDNKRDRGNAASETRGVGADAASSHWIAGLAGWRLGQFEQATQHFAVLAASRSASDWMQAAGAYWAGRTEEMRGQTSAASKWFGVASRFPATFYGMLAERKLGLTRPAEDAGGDSPIPLWKPHGGFKVDPALVYAVARQESGFDPSAVSPAGAAGLMQIMPGTAHLIAPGVRNALFDPSTNLDLGQRYLRALMQDPSIGENLLLLAVAYNRGSGNPAEFRRMLNFGDPLLAIESVSSTETRNFIQRVLASYWLYKARLGGDTNSLTELANGHWPTYRWCSAEAPRARSCRLVDD
jgi:hypothetical protein